MVDNTLAESHSNPKLDSLRAAMEREGVQAYVCFHMDAHNSEYIAPCDERIAYISGFNGSNGVAVVTKDDARCWTDGRYYLQISKQLECTWTMMKMERNEKNWFEWLNEQLPKGSKIGLDYTQYPSASAKARKEFFAKKDIEFVSIKNLVDEVWGAERPARPENAIMHLDF